ncbi:hypothetical protein VTI74DRAFT_9536 [Chaetomium olivicolor]
MTAAITTSHRPAATPSLSRYVDSDKLLCLKEEQNLTTPEKPEEGQSATGNLTSRSSSYVSQFSPFAEPRGDCPPPSTTIAPGPELLHSPYWPLSAHGAALPPFASHGGNPMWEHTQPGAGHSVLEYGHYTSMLGVHTSMLPQTVFRAGEVLDNLGVPPAPDKQAGSNSTLYASSDMLQAMVLRDESPQPWNTSPTSTQGEFDGARCVDVTEMEVSNTSWSKPEVVDKTVSPNMLRIQQTPSPSTSCESIRTSYLAEDANINPALASVDPIPSQGPKTHGSHTKSRKLLPDTREQRAHRSSRRTSNTLSDQPSPTPARKLTRLRPKPACRRAPSPPPPPAQTRAQVELADRMSKDEFLVRQKQLGMTYKEIRRMGGFTEAESTLRGRYRTLTKCREARVRKPEWGEKDVGFLSFFLSFFGSLLFVGVCVSMSPKFSIIPGPAVIITPNSLSYKSDPLLFESFMPTPFRN